MMITNTIILLQFLLLPKRVAIDGLRHQRKVRNRAKIVLLVVAVVVVVRLVAGMPIDPDGCDA